LHVAVSHSTGVSSLVQFDYWNVQAASVVSGTNRMVCGRKSGVWSSHRASVGPVFTNFMRESMGLGKPEIVAPTLLETGQNIADGSACTEGNGQTKKHAEVQTPTTR